MNENFLLLNRHLDNPEQFSTVDPHLSKLKHLRYVNSSQLLYQLPTAQPGIYTLTGGGLVGKTTLLKQWMAKLLSDGIPAKSITFFSGEFIDNYHMLINYLEMQLKNKPPDMIQYVLLDDVTRISGWDKAIKFSAEIGLLDRIVLLLASSDRNLQEKLKLHFPNRQYAAQLMDFHLYPLSFRECVLLKHPNPQTADINLTEEFNQYLLHGGFLIAINDFAMHGEILESTLTAYSDWMRKEILRHERQESFLREILTAIIEHYQTPITWNTITKELSINHPKTIGDYVALLESLDAVFVQFALLEKRLTKAPKKARKVMFFDPFIFHSMKAWLDPIKNPFETQIKPVLDNPEWCAKIVDACVTTHFSRYYPAYYIKAEGEIDLAYIFNRRFWPILITWTNQLHAKDLKQILKYPNGKILTKSQRSGTIEHIRTEPLPQALWRLQD